LAKRLRWQVAQPPLHGPGLLQHVVDQLERQVLGELAQMTGREDALGNGDRPGKGGRGRLDAQRDLLG
jgi:hypothetical protein